MLVKIGEGLPLVRVPDGASEEQILAVVKESGLLEGKSQPTESDQARASIEPTLRADKSEFKRGIESGSKTLGADMYGLAALTGDSLGIDDLTQFGLAGYERKSKEAERVAPRVQSLDQINDIGDFFDAASGWLGQAVPSAATSVAGAGAGSLVGRAVVKRAAAQLVEKGIEKKAAEAAVQRVLASPAQRQLMASAMKRGALTGAFVASAGQQQGALYGELREAGIEDAAAPAWLFGAAQGALDIIPELALANKLLPGQLEKELSSSLVRGLAKSTAKQTALESGTEGAQSVLGSLARITSGKDQNWEDKDTQALLDSMAAGAVVGAVTGGGASVVERLRNKKPVQETPAFTEGEQETESERSGVRTPSAASSALPPEASDPIPQPEVANEPAPIQEPQAPAPSVEPQEQVPVDAVRAPVGAPVYAEPPPGDPYVPAENGPTGSDEGVNPPSREDMTARAKTLREQIERFKQRQPTPTAEPASDLQAQIRDLQDDQNPRRGVYFSPDNVEQNGQMLDGLQGYAKVRNVDGQGGVLVMKPRDLAEFRARSAQGEPRDALIGEFTLAGEGKPETDNPVVIQQKDEAGAVTAESVVDGNDAQAMQARATEYEQEGRTVEAVQPEAALERRATATNEPARAPTVTSYRDAKTADEFSYALENAAFLDPANDGPESRLEAAKFANWILKGATPEQRAAYKAFKATKRKSDRSNVLSLDEKAPADEQYSDTPEERDAIQQYGEKSQDAEAILGKGGTIHGTKRVRSKREKVDPRYYKAPEYQAQAWIGDDGELRAERLARTLNEVDDHSIYEEREVNSKDAEELGLAGPGWYVFQFSKDPSGPLERNYAKNYGASLTVPQVIIVGLARAKERYDKLSPSEKSPNNPLQWGVELTNVGEDGKAKKRMVAAKELTEMGLQADPKLRDIENFNERMIAGFFHGVSLLYAGKAKWVPSIPALPEARHMIGINPAINRSGSSSEILSKWLSPNTIIAESGGKKVTLGNALTKGSGLSASEKEVIRNLSGRDFGAAWNEIVRRRFENALRLGAPAAVAKRKAVEADIKARRDMKRAESLIDALDKQLAEEQNEEKRNEYRLRRAQLMLEIAKAEKRIGSVGYDPSADNELRRKILDEVADQTEEDIYIPPEEVPLEHQEGDFILSRLESEEDQARRSAKQSFVNDPFTRKAGDSAIGTVGAAGSGPRTAEELAKDTRPQVLSPNATPEARQYVADLKAKNTIAKDSMGSPVEAHVGKQAYAEGTRKIVAALKQFLKITPNIAVYDDINELRARLRDEGDEEALEGMMDIREGILSGKTPGFVVRERNGQAYIWMNSTLPIGDYLKTLSHEVGHLFYRQHFFEASPETQNALKAAWTKDLQGTDAFRQKRAMRGFEEWMADQLAAWVGSNKKARSLVEKFFDGLVEALRKAWAAINKQYPLDQSFANFVTEVVTRPNKVFDGSEHLQSLGIAADELFDLNTEPSPKAWPKEVADRARAIKAKYKTVDSMLDFVGESAMAMHERLTASLHARITRMGVPAFDQLRRMFYLRPGEAGGFTYDQAVNNRYNNFRRQFDTILEGVGEDNRTAFHEFLQSERATKEAPANIREAVAQFREFQRRVYEYQREAHLPIRELYKEDREKPAAERRGHFPQVADKEELLKPDAVETLFNAIQAAGIKMSRQDVVDMVANMTDDNFAVEFDPANIEDVSGNPRAPFYQSIRSRSLPDDVRKAIQGIKDENGKPRFYAKDINSVMHGYLRQSVRRAEFNKLLGDTEWDMQENGKFDSSRNFNRIMKQADEQGVTNEQRATMTDAMSAFLGQYNRINSEPIRKIVKSVSFYQNLRTLMLVSISSIPEFATLFLRTGNFGDTWASVRRSAKDAFNGSSYNALRDYGFAVDGTDATAFNEIKDAKDYNSKIDRASEAFFRAVGLTKWTNWMRGVSLNVSIDYLKKHASRVAEGLDTDGDSARRLEELGLTVDDLKAWAEAGEPVYGTNGVTPEDIRMGRSNLTPEQLESVRKVTGGVVRMVNQIVLNPNAAVKTLWRSDQHFALIGQLGSFTYAFLNEVLGRAWYELTRNGATNAQRAAVMASMALMMALTAFGLELKELLQYSLWGKDSPTDDMSVPKYLQTIVARTGVLGTAQLGVDAASAAGANKSPLLAFVGPTLGQVSDAFTSPPSKTFSGAIPFISQTPGLREPLRDYLKGE